MKKRMEERTREWVLEVDLGEKSAATVWPWDIPVGLVEMGPYERRLEETREFFKDLCGARALWTERAASTEASMAEAQWRGGRQRPSMAGWGLRYESCMQSREAGRTRKMELQTRVRDETAPDGPSHWEKLECTWTKGGCYHWGEILRCHVPRGLTLLFQPSAYIDDCSISKKLCTLQQIISVQLILITLGGKGKRTWYLGLVIL